jgi:hypothetical protein
MSAPELNLPQYLYVEAIGDDGSVTGRELDADRLLVWAGHGYGNSITDYCNRLLEQEFLTIENWQEQRLLQLDEQWQEAENGEDDDAAEQFYDQACERVLEEASQRRANATAQITQQQSAIEELVRDAEAHLEKNRPAEDDNASMGLMLLLAAAGVLVFTLLT